MNISMKLVYQHMAVFFNLSPISDHLHPLQVENCDSNSRLVVDDDDNSKFRDERVKCMFCLKYNKYILIMLNEVSMKVSLKEHGIPALFHPKSNLPPVTKIKKIKTVVIFFEVVNCFHALQCLH